MLKSVLRRAASRDDQSAEARAHSGIGGKGNREVRQHRHSLRPNYMRLTL
jgi:hypothetical protein